MRGNEQFSATKHHQQLRSNKVMKKCKEIRGSGRDPWYFGHVGMGAQMANVLRTLITGHSTLLVGNVVTCLETSVAEQIGVENPIAVSSATSAFEFILRDLAVGPGDEIIVPAFGWMSVPGAVIYSGAQLRLVDVDQGLHASWPMIRSQLNGDTRAVVLVHMRGVPAPDTVQIADELRQRDIQLIEDCAQAWGSRIAGHHVGTFGDYAFFSMQHFKLIVTGEGGFITTRHSGAAARLRWLSGRMDVDDRSHPWPQNVRLSEIQAAVGLPQVQRLWRTVGQLRLLAAQMAPRFAAIDGLVLQPVADDVEPNGVSVPVWCESRQSAEHLVELLACHNVPAFRPGRAGDLHNALAWPASAAELDTLVGLHILDRYVDVPVPLLPRREWPGFLRRIECALEKL